mmetsp:Transcript_21279/g.87005  ORF Transcript_21279/g.87005 Transcript_21279/m.87005 type:complete len:95 (-) Transcript_21279:2819-3103(-)
MNQVLAQAGSAFFRSMERVPTAGVLGGVREMKVVSALEQRCRSCRIVRRGRALYNLCDDRRRHNQRQGRLGKRNLPHQSARAKERPAFGRWRWW